VTVVLETESARAANRIGLSHTLAALAKQDYPRERVDIVVIDGGAFPDLPAIVATALPGARLVDGRGLTKYQMKNLGAEVAAHDVVAYVDSDCALSSHWVTEVVRSLVEATGDVAGVQGRTHLARGPFSRQVNALTHGLRSRGTGTTAPRILSDNCAFRREMIRRFPFVRPELSTAPESVLMAHLLHHGFRVLMNERMAIVHDYPGLGFLLARGYGTGVCMMRIRRTDRSLRAWWAGRLGPLGPPILTAGKLVRDLRQIAINNPMLGLGWTDWLAFVPLYVAYYAAHLVGGYAAILGFPTPRF
jgi:hypothetical protein